MAETAILVTRHQQVASLGENGVNLTDVTRNHHRIHVGTSDEDAVNYVRRRETQNHRTVFRYDKALRLEGELSSYDAARHLPGRVDGGPKVGLGELPREMKRVRVDGLDIAWRVYVLDEARIEPRR
jgi:hypothetical protein